MALIDNAINSVVHRSTGEIMWQEIKNWYHKRYKAPFTVACDISPYWTPINTHEQLFHFNGLARARKFCHRWVWEHPSGQARILEGHVNYENADRQCEKPR